MFLTYMDFDKRIEIDNPSEDQFKDALGTLNAWLRQSDIILGGDHFVLSLASEGSNGENRVLVQYTNFDPLQRVRTLIDTDIPIDDEWGEWIIDIWTEGETGMPIALTVDRQVAIEVALYIFHHGKLPLGYSWNTY